MGKNFISNATEELYRIFGALNKRSFNGELPEPIIIIQKGKKNVLGAFSTKKVWYPFSKEEDVNKDEGFYELTIVAENLNRPVVDIVGTVLHEMVHYNNILKKIKGCKGKKHNEAFKKEAERVGLICTEEDNIGWAITEVGEDLEKFIVDELKPNKEVFSYFRFIPVKSSAKPKKKNKISYKCETCGEEVKGKRGLNIYCEDCGVKFTPETEEE